MLAPSLRVAGQGRAGLECPAGWVVRPLEPVLAGRNLSGMTHDGMRPVVVGVDGSPSAAAALKVAVAEALTRGAPLRIVHAYVWPQLYACLVNLPYRPGEWQPPRSAVEMVEAVARRVRMSHPQLTVQTAVTSGGGGPVLVDESARAALVVVGARGTRGIAGLLGGPTVRYLSAHAHCPVLIVGDGQAPVTAAAPVATAGRG